jgi:hypothetical protein
MLLSKSHDVAPETMQLRDPVEENARFTSLLGIVLMVLLVVEVATVLLGVRSVLDLHVIAGFMVGALTIPKLVTTGYRLVQYYRHQPAFASKGPPPTFLRLLSPVMAAAGIALLASGALTLLGPSSLHGTALSIHKVTFYLFMALIVVHTAAHLKEAIAHSAADTRGAVVLAGRRLRFGTVLGGLAAGAAAGTTAAIQASSYLATWPHK